MRPDRVPAALRSQRNGVGMRTLPGGIADTGSPSLSGTKAYARMTTTIHLRQTGVSCAALPCVKPPTCDCAVGFLTLFTIRSNMSEDAVPFVPSEGFVSSERSVYHTLAEPWILRRSTTDVDAGFMTSSFPHSLIHKYDVTRTRSFFVDPTCNRRFPRVRSDFRDDSGGL